MNWRVGIVIVEISTTSEYDSSARIGFLREQLMEE